MLRILTFCSLLALPLVSFAQRGDRPTWTPRTYSEHIDHLERQHRNPAHLRPADWAARETNRLERELGPLTARQRHRIYQANLATARDHRRYRRATQRNEQALLKVRQRRDLAIRRELSPRQWARYNQLAQGTARRDARRLHPRAERQLDRRAEPAPQPRSFRYERPQAVPAPRGYRYQRPQTAPPRQQGLPRQFYDYWERQDRERQSAPDIPGANPTPEPAEPSDRRSRWDRPAPQPREYRSFRPEPEPAPAPRPQEFRSFRPEDQ